MRELRVLKNKRLKRKLLDEVFLQNKILMHYRLQIKYLIQLAKTHKGNLITIEEVQKTLFLSESDALGILIDMCRLDIIRDYGSNFALTGKEL